MTSSINTNRLQKIESSIGYIRTCQQANGAICWYPGAKLDPWDHTEAAMALAIAGEQTRASAAFHWLQQQQNTDGSWYADYFVQVSTGKHSTKIETNFVAYPATGIWHYYLVSGDLAFARDFFPMVENAIEFVLRHQTEEGDILWAICAEEPLAKDALVTACSSILRSLECALHLAQTLKASKPHWLSAYHRLADALLNKPWRFDRTWESKARYSMDWFYPILAGIFTPQQAQLRLQQRWQEFIKEEQGCRCVSDEPWVTVAETCELVMAVQASGQPHKAQEIFRWIQQRQDKDGGFWTGYNFRDKVIWPKEKTSWTAAATVLAADALYQLSPAATLFTSPSSFYTASAMRCRITSD